MHTVKVGDAGRTIQDKPATGEVSQDGAKSPFRGFADTYDSYHYHY